MRTKISFVIVALLVVSLFSACEMLNIKLRVNDEGVHDEVYVHEVPFDKAYLTVLDAIDSIPGWKLEGTVQTEGKIEARQDGLRGKLVTIIVKRQAKKQSSFELHHGSQNIVGADKLMREIDYYFIQ